MRAYPKNRIKNEVWGNGGVYIKKKNTTVFPFSILRTGDVWAVDQMIVLFLLLNKTKFTSVDTYDASNEGH